MNLTDAEVYATITEAYTGVLRMMLDWAKDLEPGNEREEVLHHIAVMSRGYHGLTEAIIDYNGGV